METSSDLLAKQLAFIVVKQCASWPHRKPVTDGGKVQVSLVSNIRLANSKTRETIAKTLSASVLSWGREGRNQIEVFLGQVCCWCFRELG